MLVFVQILRGERPDVVVAACAVGLGGLFAAGGDDEERGQQQAGRAGYWHSGILGARWEGRDYRVETEGGRRIKTLSRRVTSI